MTSARDLSLTEQDLDMTLKTLMSHGIMLKKNSPPLTREKYIQIFKNFEASNDLSDTQKNKMNISKFNFGFLLCMKKENSIFEDKLRGFIKDDNFFIKSASERLEILQNLRKSDEFLKFLMDHKQDAKIFLKESLDNRSDLLDQIAKNRLGLNILDSTPSHAAQPQRAQQERKLEHKGDHKAGHNEMLRYGRFHMPAPERNRGEEFVRRLFEALRAERDRPRLPLRNRQEVLAVPTAQEFGITQVFEKHKIKIDGLEDFRCPLSLCCIVGPVYRVQNGDDAKPHYQYYDKAMLDTDFKAQTAKVKIDPYTRKPLKASDIVDGTEQYRKEFMAMVEKNLKEQGMPEEKISETVAALRKEFFGEQLQLGRRAGPG